MPSDEERHLKYSLILQLYNIRYEQQSKKASDRFLGITAEFQHLDIA